MHYWQKNKIKTFVEGVFGRTSAAYNQYAWVTPTPNPCQQANNLQLTSSPSLASLCYNYYWLRELRCFSVRFQWAKERLLPSYCKLQYSPQLGMLTHSYGRPAVHHAGSVDLYGSWDNFSTPYPMQKDMQMGHGHWYGCPEFRNVICDGEVSNCTMPEDRPLKMGGTYWYYVSICTLSVLRTFRLIYAV